MSDTRTPTTMTIVLLTGREYKFTQEERPFLVHYTDRDTIVVIEEVNLFNGKRAKNRFVFNREAVAYVYMWEVEDDSPVPF